MLDLLIKFLYFAIPLLVSTTITFYIKKFFDRKQPLLAYYGHTAVGKITNRGIDIKIFYCLSTFLGNTKSTNQNFHLIYVTDSTDEKKQWYLTGRTAAQADVMGYLDDLTDKYSLLTWVADFLRKKTFSSISEDDRLLLRDKVLSAFKIPLEITQKTIVFTHSLIVKNSGDRIINNIRIGHFVPQPINTISDCISVYPPEDYQIRKIDDVYEEIIFKSLAPKTEVTITYTYLPPITRDSFNTYVKSDEGYAKFVNIILNKQYPKWINYIVLVFLIIGLASTIYLGIKILGLFACISHMCPYVN